MHVRLRNVLYHQRSIEVPGTDHLAIRRRHKAPVVVHTGDGVRAAQLLVVVLGDIA
jgi:hypothetical protein